MLGAVSLYDVFGGNDTLSGGSGNDHLVISETQGLPIVHFNLGDGQDTISDIDYKLGSLVSPVDFSRVAVNFGVGIHKEDLEIIENEESLILAIKNTRDRVTFEGFFLQPGNTRYRV